MGVRTVNGHIVCIEVKTMKNAEKINTSKLIIWVVNIIQSIFADDVKYNKIL